MGITPELEGKKFSQPAAFVAGSADDVLLYDPAWRDKFPQAFHDLRCLELIEGAGHWVQAEKPKETNECILRFCGGCEDDERLKADKDLEKRLWVSGRYKHISQNQLDQLDLFRQNGTSVC